MTYGCPTHCDTLHAAYRYDAWGSPVGGLTDQWGKPTGITVATTSLITTTQLATDIASHQILHYAGYAYDSESGLYYCSARYYDPATRQWTTADSAKADGEQSAYQYGGGEPVAHVDPTGLYYVPGVGELNKLELWLIVRYPGQVLHWRHSALFALRRSNECAAKGWFTPASLSNNGKGDAFRHALWNVVLSQRIGTTACKRWTDAHENGRKNNPPCEKKMDLHNNGVGRAIYTEDREVITSHASAESWWTSEQVNSDKRLWWFGHHV